MIIVFGLVWMLRNVIFGNGDFIFDEVVWWVNLVYKFYIKSIIWEEGDILLFDNFRFMYGCRFYLGSC